MSIYIKTTEGAFVLASDIDLINRGYSSTQDLGSVPVLADGEIKLTVTDFTRDRKVKIIKIVRQVCNDHYGKKTYQNSVTYKSQPPPQDKSEYDPNAFGLKHMKHFVEGQCSLTIHTACYREIVNQLEKESTECGAPIKCTFEEVHTKGSSNLERLLDHKVKLREEMSKVDDLIAYQLYS